MKRTLLNLPIIILLLCSFKDNDDDILNKTSAKLSSIKTIEYEATMHFHQNGIGNDNIIPGLCYFDFSSKDSLIGAKYYFVGAFPDRKITWVFNGSQTFESDDNEKRILFSNKQRIVDVVSPLFTANSIYKIRKLLPQFINDPTNQNVRLRDTIINNKECFQFRLFIPNKHIDMYAGIKLTNQIGTDEKYQLAISKDEYLPVQFSTIYPDNAGYCKTTFSHLKFPVQKSDSSWTIESFPNDYLRMTLEDYFLGRKNKVAIMAGLLAPDWTLPMLKGDSVKLSDLKGSLVLLEFWFPGCGACMQATSGINDIQEKYGNKGLKVFGIEFQQLGDKGLTEYIEKHKIKYPTLYKGKSIAPSYAVSGAPTFFLINKDGKIIYTCVGFDKEKLIAAINENTK